MVYHLKVTAAWGPAIQVVTMQIMELLLFIIIIFVIVQKSKRLLCTGVIIMNVQVSTKLI